MTRPGNGEADAKVTLIAEIVYGTEKLTKEFEVIVSAMSETTGIEYFDCNGLPWSRASVSVQDIIFGNVEDEICITFDDVAMTADWEPLPYCPDTYSFKKAIFTGKDIMIHYTGKWGTKGHTQHPWVEMVGFGHMYGDFYLEGTPYTHQMLCSEIEVWNGTKEFLQKAGFTSIS